MISYGDRELDVSIATKIFGWKWVKAIMGGRMLRPANYDGEACAETGEKAFLNAFWADGVLRFGTDPCAYMGILAEMERRGWMWSLRKDGGGYRCSLCFDGFVAESFEAIVGEAVCCAALAAVAKGDRT